MYLTASGHQDVCHKEVHNTWRKLSDSIPVHLYGSWLVFAEPHEVTLQFYLAVMKLAVVVFFTPIIILFFI